MGTIKTGWEKTSEGYRVNVTVPFNTKAILILPNREPISLIAGNHTITV
jgi:hypothetical protein